MNLLITCSEYSKEAVLGHGAVPSHIVMWSVF